MKKTAKKNIIISNAIAKCLGVNFLNEEFTLEKWGSTDNWARYSSDTIILLECEWTQKHPNTNVLKLYPYLQENPKCKIILVHYFSTENKAPKNRIALCTFLGKKLMAEYAGRFEYFKFNCPLKEIKYEINNLKISQSNLLKIKTIEPIKSKQRVHEKRITHALS